MRNEPMRRNDLPETCFSILPSSGQLIIIRCGERGYYPSEWDTGKREENREIASSHNARRDITDIQEAAMLAGSMFGWNTPGANPQWYLDNARYVNSNIVQGHIKDPIMSVYYPVSSFLLCYEIMGKQHFYLPMDKLPQELMSQRSQFIMLPDLVRGVPVMPVTATFAQNGSCTIQLEQGSYPALLPIQIAYYTGLRIGEACSLTWQDIDLKEQRLTVRRSIRYNSARHRTEIGTTKRKKIRSVDFCNTLADILKEAKKAQMLDRLACGPLYSQNYYLSIEEKNRTYYEVYSLPVSEHPPEGYQAISLVCVRQDGRYESPATVSNMCQTAKKRVDGMESFHFHQLRHTFTSNLLSYGAAPKDVQELLGHSDVTTTMNIYAHASKEAKRDAAKLLDKVQ